MKYYFVFILFIILIKVNAQDTISVDSVYQLEDVVITYSADWSAPITHQNLYSKDLKAKSVGQEPSFILMQTPSITAYSDAGSTQGYSYFRMRGIDQTRVNFTLDGVPLNEPEDQGAYFSNYPDVFNSISKIQIQRGVGTTKNGVASYAGCLELFSPNLSDSARSSIGIGYGSYNSSRIFGEFNSGIVNRKALYFRASNIHSDGYKYNSSNNSQSVFLSSGLFYNKVQWKLNFIAGQQRNQQAWLGVSDSLIRIDRRTNGNKNERDHFTQCFVQLHNKWFVSTSSMVQSGIYYTYLNGNYDFNLNNFLGLPSTNELYNYALRSNLIGFFSNYTYSGRRFSWTTGVHGNNYDRRHIGSENTVGELYKNTGFKNEASIFSKLNYRTKRILLFADLQYRYSSFTYAGNVPLNKITWTFLNPKAGISYNLKPNILLYYAIGQSGREPTRNDLFGGNDNLLADSLGQPLLSVKSPEYVVDQELGWKYQTTKLNINYNLFYMNFRNEIVLNGQFGPNALSLTSNVDQSIRTGMELSCQLRLTNHISLINNSSYTYSRIREQKELFTPILTPKLIVNQEIVYFYKRLTVSLNGRYQSRSYIDFANTTAINHYILINARVQYTIRSLQLSFFLNNLLNTKYYNNGYVDVDHTRKFFVQAPINYYISMTYNF